jgi:hypothetical protein
VPRFRSAFGFGFAIATLSGQVFAQGAPSEPGRGAVPRPFVPATPTKGTVAPRAPSAGLPSAPPSTAPSAKAGAPAPAASAAAPQVPSPVPPAPAPAPAPAPTPVPSSLVAVNAPDIVRLRNGGILRGTISELVPGDYVTLVLITGETRKVAYSDVLYAGVANAEAGAPPAPVAPASIAPPSPAASARAGSAAASPAIPSGGTQPFAVLHADESIVSVVSKRDGITLSRRSGSASGSAGRYRAEVTGYDELCTTPCQISLPAGTHTFAVAKPGGKPLEADPVTLPSGKATMTVSVIDRTAARVGLGVLGAAGLISGFALVLSDSGGSAGSPDIVGPLVLGALGTGVLVLAFGISDGASVVVKADARNSALNGSPAWLYDRARDTSSLRDRVSGMTFRVRF